MKTNNIFGRIIISAFVLLQSILLSPKYQTFIGDKEVFRYMGMLIAQGGVPYRDAFDHKPPVIYFLAALSDFLGPWGLWLITTLLVLAAALLFYQACIHLCAKIPIVYPLTFIILMRYGPIIEGGGLTREVTASLVLILFSLYIIQSRRMMLFGALCATIFLTQQNELPAASPIVLLALLSSLRTKTNRILDWNRLFKRIFCCAAGGAIISLAIILYFLFHRALNDFWQDAFIFSAAVYSDPPQHPLLTMRRLAGYLAYYRLLYPVVLLMFLGFIGMILKKSTTPVRAILLASSAGMVLQLCSISLSNKYYGHYFISCIPYITILMLGCGLFLQKALPPRMAWMIPTALLLAVCTRHLEIDKFYRLNNFVSANTYKEKYPPFYFSELQRLYGRPGSFYVFRNKDYLAINTDLHIIAPTIWIYDHHWDMFPQWDENGTIFEGLIGDLCTANTEYILDFSPVFPLSRPHLQKMWDRFIESRYDVVSYFDDAGRNRIWNFYHLKSQAPQAPHGR